MVIFDSPHYVFLCVTPQLQLHDIIAAKHIPFPFSIILATAA